MRNERKPAFEAAYIGLGANLGPARVTVQQAITWLDALDKTELVMASPLYRTRAWGGVAQPDFINAVACVRTALSPIALLHALWSLEQRAGRVRALRWGPRSLDLDILLYGQRICTDKVLTIPHPYILQRAFVLVPLMDIAPDLCIPGYGLVRHALQQIGSEGTERLNTI